MIGAYQVKATRWEAIGIGAIMNLTILRGGRRARVVISEWLPDRQPGSPRQSGDCRPEMRHGCGWYIGTLNILMLRPKSHSARQWGEGQNQDQEGHGGQAWRLPQTLRGIKMAGQQATLLVSGSPAFPDTEEVTSSNLVPPTTFMQVKAMLTKIDTVSGS